jgi:hypothetical protein
MTSQDMVNTSHFPSPLVHLKLYFFYPLDNNISFMLSFGRSTGVDLGAARNMTMTSQNMVNT